MRTNFIAEYRTSSVSFASSRTPQTRNYEGREAKSTSVSPKFEPIFKKLDVEGDRNKLNNGFVPSVRSGTESGGGGSEERDLFYTPLRKAIAVLKRETIFHFHDGKKIEISRLENALRVSTVIPTKKQLYDRENIRVDLKNDPEDLVIWFNVPTWIQWSETKKIRYGLHEVLGILNIPDPLYKYSAQLEQYVTENGHLTPPVTEVQSGVLTHDSAHKFLSAAQTAGENIVLMSQCQRFETNHQGYCMIKSVMENGVMRQLVYLGQGSLEELLANKTIKMPSHATILRVVVNVPAKRVGFILALNKAVNGTCEVFNRDDCLLRGYALESELDVGNLCILSRFTKQ